MTVFPKTFAISGITECTLANIYDSVLKVSDKLERHHLKKRDVHDIKSYM